MTWFGPTSEPTFTFQLTASGGGTPVVITLDPEDIHRQPGDLFSAIVTDELPEGVQLPANVPLTFSVNAKLDDGATGPDSPSIAVPPATLYLHGDGPPANPVNLTLNNDQPTNPQSQTKRKDSPPINFNSGNLWKEVGTWTTLAVNTTPAELEVWLGLKNTDDTNTAFDLQVVVNGDLDHPAG